MSLITNHVRDVTNNRNNMCDLFETRFKELQTKIESLSNNQSIDTTNFVSKQEIDELVMDLKDCFSDVLNQTPRDVLNLNTKLSEMQQSLTSKLNDFENRLVSLENANITVPETTVRIPKLKIEKSVKKNL